MNRKRIHTQASSLIISLNGTDPERQRLLDTLQNHGSIAVGEVIQNWLPIGTETASAAESHDLHDWIGSLPGVAYVDVVAVHFHDQTLSPNPV